MLLAQNTQHCVFIALITTTKTAANITLYQKQYRSHNRFKIIQPLQHTEPYFKLMKLNLHYMYQQRNPNKLFHGLVSCFFNT